MPAAPSLDHLLDFESRWDEALAAVLRPLGLPVHTAFDTTHEKLAPPYLEAMFTFQGSAPAAGGTLALQRAGVAPTTFDPVSYLGQIEIQLHLHRGKHPVAEVEGWRGGVRRTFLPRTAALNPVTLPYYQVATITSGAGERLTSEDRDLDVVIFRYTVQWGIRPGAWLS